jgi:hypothetical protein
MEQNDLIRAILTVLIVGIITPMILWYWGVRTNRQQFKSLAVIVAVVYFAVVAMDLGHRWWGWFEEDTYRTGIVGPARRATEQIVTGEILYHVKDADKRHLLDLLPVAKLGESAVGFITLRYEVHAPNGDVLAKGQDTLQPDKNEKWTAIHAEFPAHELGEHKVLVEVPKPAGEVKVTIREVKR